MNQIKTTQIDNDREFRRYYEKHLKPLEQHFESLRRKAVKETKKRVISALAVWLTAAVVIGWLAPLKDEFTAALFAACVLMAGIGFGLWAWLPAQAHIDQLKEQILPRIVSFFGDLRYKSKPDFELRQYRDWMVLPVFDETYVEDQIEGCYHGVPLKLAEVKLRYRKTRRSAGNSVTEYITSFKGLMNIFELEQEYPGVTLIRNQGSRMIEHLDESLEEVSAGSGFEVFATNEAPAEKLADAWFLERLAEIAADFEAQHLWASFHVNQLVMMIGHKGDYFEISPRQKTNFAKDAVRVREQLERIFTIVEQLLMEGTSSGDKKDVQSSQHPVFPDLPGINDAAQPDAGNWGCFIVFVMFTISISALLLLLETKWLLWWSAFGGLLISSGLFQTIRGFWRHSVLSFALGMMFLAGAFMVIYFCLL